MITLTTKVAKAVTGITGNGGRVFNDKLKSGGRSLKVWGWKLGEYKLAKVMLQEHGCQVKLVEFTSNGWNGGMVAKKKQIRLHVVE